MLHTLASSGCRVSTVVTLISAQVVTRAGSFFVVVLGKDHVMLREASLSHEAYAAIEAWLARRPVASAALFTCFSGKGHRPTAPPMDRRAALRAAGCATLSPSLEELPWPSPEFPTLPW